MRHILKMLTYIGWFQWSICSLTVRSNMFVNVLLVVSNFNQFESNLYILKLCKTDGCADRYWRIRIHISTMHVCGLLTIFWWMFNAVSTLMNLFQSMNSPSQLNWQANGNNDPCGQSWTGITCSGNRITEM
jgi:hypothetical protein